MCARERGRRGENGRGREHHSSSCHTWIMILAVCCTTQENWWHIIMQFCEMNSYTLWMSWQWRWRMLLSIIFIAFSPIANGFNQYLHWASTRKQLCIEIEFHFAPHGTTDRWRHWYFHQNYFRLRPKFEIHAEKELKKKKSNIRFSWSKWPHSPKWYTVKETHNGNTNKNLWFRRKTISFYSQSLGLFSTIKKNWAAFRCGTDANNFLLTVLQCLITSYVRRRWRWCRPNEIGRCWQIFDFRLGSRIFFSSFVCSSVTSIWFCWFLFARSQYLLESDPNWKCRPTVKRCTCTVHIPYFANWKRPELSKSTREKIVLGKHTEQINARSAGVIQRERTYCGNVWSERKQTADKWKFVQLSCNYSPVVSIPANTPPHTYRRCN